MNIAKPPPPNYLTGNIVDFEFQTGKSPEIAHTIQHLDARGRQSFLIFCRRPLCAAQPMKQTEGNNRILASQNAAK
jgi:hypothetical protein